MLRGDVYSHLSRVNCNHFAEATLVTTTVPLVAIFPLEKKYDFRKYVIIAFLQLLKLSENISAKKLVYYVRIFTEDVLRTRNPTAG